MQLTPTIVRILYVGPLWRGSTTLQRCQALSRISGIALNVVDTNEPPRKASLGDRIRQRLRYPADHSQTNERLLAAVMAERPDIVFIDGCRTVNRATLLMLRNLGVRRLAYYSPDDITASHNSSRQLESCDDLWDVFFTTKSFNISELKSRGVKRPVLVGNSFDPEIHRPMSPAEVGVDYERFDVVLVGTYERDRLTSINLLGEAGFSVVVYGNAWEKRHFSERVLLRRPVYALEYARALHTGRLALCPLRKLNRDRITTRSIEIPACRRAMIAEKTEEHDAAFLDGIEYMGYRDDVELCNIVRLTLECADRRRALADSGWRRTQNAGYSCDARAQTMFQTLLL